MDPATVEHDVFVSYSRQDSIHVEVLASRLAEEVGLRVWLDRTRLQPGFSWREEIEAAMNAAAAMLIVWGPHGLGPVQRQERDLAYVIRDARPDFRVIYAFLPNTPPPQGTWANVDTWIRFEGGLDEDDTFQGLTAAIKGEAGEGALTAELANEPAPYRGLAAFSVEDARFFFGRGAYVEEVLERLPHHPFLAVLGPSGSGKTSLIEAGVMARLRANIIPGSSEWPTIIVRPGPQPLRSLSISMARLQPAGDRLKTEASLFERLQADPQDLPNLLRTLLPDQGQIVLIVDRLEELFTLCEVQETRQVFLDALLALVSYPHGPAWIIATMRADFYGHVGHYADFAGEVVNHQLYLKPLTVQEVAEVIEAPATEVGAIFEKGLAMRVRDDAQGREEISLPLLQETLDLLWRKRRGRWLTWDAYEEIGGVAGALRYHADRVIEALGPREREVARRLFTRLIWLEERGGTLAGRRSEKTALVGSFPDPAAAERILQGLADQRLVVLRGGGDGATAELIHDTLPLHWEKLREWVQGDQEFLLWRQRLRTALKEWQRTGQDEGALLRGASLAEAERWLSERSEDLTPDERDYVQQSIAWKRRQEQREKRRRRFILGSSMAVAVVMALLGYISLKNAREAREAARLAHARQLAAEGQIGFEENPMLGLRLALEGVSLLSPQDGDALNSILNTAHRLSRPGRLLKLGGNVESISTKPDANIFVLNNDETPGELRRTVDGSVISGLAAEVSGAVFIPTDDPTHLLVRYNDGRAELRSLSDTSDIVTIDKFKKNYKVYFSPDPAKTYFLVSRSSYSTELRRTKDGSVLNLAGKYSNIDFSTDPSATYFVPHYVSKPGELRRTADGSLVAVLSGAVHGIRFSPDPSASYFVVQYSSSSLKHELRRSADGTLITRLTGRFNGFRFDSSPDTPYFMVRDKNGPGDVRRINDGSLVTLGGDVRQVCFQLYPRIRHQSGVRSKGLASHNCFRLDPGGKYFLVAYSDGPSELRRTSDVSVLNRLEDSVKIVKLIPNPNGHYFMLGYENAPGELRRIADGSLYRKLTGKVHSFIFSPNPETPYFAVSYRDASGELRRITDGSLFMKLTGKVKRFRFSPDPETRYFVVSYQEIPSELRRTDDGSLIAELGGIVDKTFFSPNPDLPYLAVGYGNAPGELRRLTDGALVTDVKQNFSKISFHSDRNIPYAIFRATDNSVAEIRILTDGKLINLPSPTRATRETGFSSDSAATYIFVDNMNKGMQLFRTSDMSPVSLSPYASSINFQLDAPDLFLVNYLEAPSELRRMSDSAVFTTLSGKATAVRLIPEQEKTYFLVHFEIGPSELYRTSDGELAATLTGTAKEVHFSPDSDQDYFVVNYDDGRSEVWSQKNDHQRLAALGLNVKQHFFDLANQRLIIIHTDGRSYMLDLGWLQAMGGEVDKIPASELIRLACEGPFAAVPFDEKSLNPYLAGRSTTLCPP